MFLGSLGGIHHGDLLFVGAAHLTKEALVGLNVAVFCAAHIAKPGVEMLEAVELGADLGVGVHHLDGN